MATNLDSGRAMLNEYLEKPLELDSGQLSTQVNLSATSLASGGLDTRIAIGGKGSLMIGDSKGSRVVIDKNGISAYDSSNRFVGFFGLE